MVPPEGDQLVLPGFEEFLVGAHREPWGGRSPRALTRGYGRFILKTQGEKKRERFGFGDQVEMWPELEKGPQLVFQLGAPLLIEPRRV